MNRRVISIPKPAKKSWSCLNIYISAATRLSWSRTNETSPRTRGALCICAMGSLKWITPDLSRRLMCRWKPPRSGRRETFSLRAERELENCGGANALKLDAFNADRPRSYHWHYCCHTHGYRGDRHFHRL